MAPENSKGNHFILHPLSMHAFMEKNSSKYPLENVTPRFKFDLQPEKISIEITTKQLAQIKILNQKWANHDRARHIRKGRPKIRIKDKGGYVNCDLKMFDFKF